jgi:hypothetical protein
MRRLPAPEPIRDAIARLHRLQGDRAHALALPGQPFDRLLLRRSRLYRRSRALYREIGGTHAPALLSSARSLSSAGLLEPRIEYSPIEAELIWRATNPTERRQPEPLTQLRAWVTSVFHEQSHRILWARLPPCPADAGGARRYLNLAESLVIAADMALGDELGPRLARELYRAGPIYSPGSRWRGLGLSRREYRNLLHAVAYASYLALEMYSAELIGRLISALFPGLGRRGPPAVERALSLNEQFIALTNPTWQSRNLPAVRRALGRGPGRRAAALSLPDDPRRNPAYYLVAEAWFAHLGL